MIVGEQPGDQEDRAGSPFVGPAGKVLDEALADARIARDGVYVTNAVKHFRWKPQGRRRIHDKPNRTEVVACRPWLDREISAARPPAPERADDADRAQSRITRPSGGKDHLRSKHRP